MDVRDLLSKDSDGAPTRPGADHVSSTTHHYPTRHAESLQFDMMQAPATSSATYSNVRATAYAEPLLPQPPSTRSRAPSKVVEFKWDQAPSNRPLRVKMYPHDTVGGITQSVKSFWGLKDKAHVSFKDNHRISFIPSYENVVDDATVHVMVTGNDDGEKPKSTAGSLVSSTAGSPEKKPYPWLDRPIEMLPPTQSISRQDSGLKKRSVSPQYAPGRRNTSARPPLRVKPYDLGEDGAQNGLSDSDGGGSVSVSSSRKAKSDQLTTAEISLDNIVEGGRRNGGKFLSSELPLFQPPALPITASMSSASPQRRMGNFQMASPYANQHTFSYDHLPSPMSYVGGFDMKTDRSSNGRLGAQPYHFGARPRHGSSSRQPSSRLSGNSASGILPTPDQTTVGSVISDEDVAWQLMRLGDASNVSRGRLSNSAIDDALSGKGDAASSGEYSEVEDLLEQEKQSLLNRRSSGPARKRQKVGGSHSGYQRDESSEDEYDDDRSARGGAGFGGMKKSRGGYKSATGKSGKSKIPPSPQGNGTVQGSRKNSSASSANPLNQYAPDEEDLSVKPRCQRCRKSKKGCDRQRPCGRCVDAGIGADGCISEEEENGRKGRFGRIMGVAIKKQGDDSVMAGGDEFQAPMSMADKQKKRKR